MNRRFNRRPSIAYIKHKYAEQNEKAAYRTSVLVIGENLPSRRFSEIRAAVRQTLIREKRERVMSILVMTLLWCAIVFLAYCGFLSEVSIV